VTAYRNKWPSDWQQHWFYHTVTPPSPRESHPLATKELPPLHESYAKNPSCPEGDEFVMMLRRFARKYNTRDIVEEYRSIPVCPLVDGWAMADDAWADDIGGIPCPDWTKALVSPPNVSAFVSFGVRLPASCAFDASRVDYSKMLICSAEEKEGGGPW
jgi:hypothetical protein